MSCESPPAKTADEATSPDFGSIFKQAGYHGSILLYDDVRKKYLGHGLNRVDSAFLPASTFKIFNSLVALETGVAPDEKFVIPWDSVTRQVAAWNQDNDMASAFRHSSVPYYQEIARRVGRERMQAYLRQEQYGNQVIGGDIDLFWLDGSLQITQRQQVEFLRKLAKNQLGFSARTQEIVRHIMIQEEGEGYVLRGKTGWGMIGERNYGWFVGWVARAEGNCFFALNICSDNPGDDFSGRRTSIVQAVLEALEWLPAAADS